MDIPNRDDDPDESNLLVWFFSSYFLGLLPILMNSLAQLLQCNFSWSAILKVQELSCFVLVLTSATLIDLMLHGKKAEYSFQLSLMFLLALLIVTAMLMGCFFYFPLVAIGNSDGLNSRLTGAAAILAGIGAVGAGVIKLRVCRKSSSSRE